MCIDFVVYLNYVYPASHFLKTDTILYKIACLSMENSHFLTQNCSSECHKWKDRFKTNECPLGENKEPKLVLGLYVVIIIIHSMLSIVIIIIHNITSSLHFH